MDKEVKNRILLGKNGTKYVVADKYVDGTYSVDAIPGSEMVKFISENKLYKDIAYITDRTLKGYRLNSLSKLFGSELDTSSKYAIYSLDSSGLMRVINLDTFEILECSKWNFQFLSKEKGFKKPYINIYLKSDKSDKSDGSVKSVGESLECYAVTNLMIDKTGSLDSNYYLGDVDYNLGTNLTAFKKVNYSNIRRNKNQLSLGADIAYSPYSLNGMEIFDVIERLDSENDDISTINAYKTRVEKDNKPVENDNEPVERDIKSVDDNESLAGLTVERDDKPVENDNKHIEDDNKPVEDDNKPVEDDTNSSIESESIESELNSSDDNEEPEDKTEETEDKPEDTADKPEETADKPEETADKTEETEDKSVETIDKTEEPEDKPEETADKTEETANEMDRFYDSNGNCIDIEGLMAYLDSKQIEKQLEETNKIDSKSSLADVLNKDTDLYQIYDINISKLDAYKDMLGILSIYDTITLDKELSHKCLVIDDIVSGSTVKYIESGIDKDGVVQVNAENVPLNVIYICYVSNNGHKKYYLMHENQDVSTVKIQCISDTMKDYDYFNTNEFRQKYNNNKLNIQYIKL